MNKINLNDREWKPFKIDEIFNVSKGVYLSKKNIKSGNIPFITAKAGDNGVTGFIGNECLFSKNSITIEKISLSAYYQPTDFYCSHDVTVLQNEVLNKEIALFINTMIKRQGIKYSYGRQAQMNVVKRETILLPVDSENKPDWIFMEKYIKQMYSEKKNKYIKYSKYILDGLEYKEIPNLDEMKWGNFKITDICNIYSGIDIYESERKVGEIPYITSTSSNNGIKYFISNKNESIESNAISVNRNGSVGYAFYHKYEALYSNDCRKLKLKKYNNEFVALFLTNQIAQQKNKYNYGYKMGTARLKKQYVTLPVNKKNEPDYDYMEQYIKNIMIKKYNAYLA